MAKSLLLASHRQPQQMCVCALLHQSLHLALATPDATRVREISATASVSASTSCSAQRVREGAATASASATGASSAQKVREAASIVAPSASVTCDAQLVSEVSATSLPTASLAANAQITIIVSTTANLAASGSATVNRVQFSGSAISAVCSTVCNAIGKWEPLPETHCSCLLYTSDAADE